MNDSIQEYAKAMSELRAARKATLKTLGLTEEGLRTLEAQALALMNGESIIHTEYGTLQKIPDREVQFYTRRSAGESEPLIKKRKLIFISKE